MNRRAINIFVKYAIKKPVLYILLLVAGCTFFSLAVAKITVPVYTTYEADITRIGNVCEIHFYDDNVLFSVAEKIYIHLDESQRLLCIDSFEVSEGKIAFSVSDISGIIDGKISVDIEMERIPLFKMLLRQGGLA